MRNYIRKKVDLEGEIKGKLNIGYISERCHRTKVVMGYERDFKDNHSWDLKKKWRIRESYSLNWRPEEELILPNQEHY